VRRALKILGIFLGAVLLCLGVAIAGLVIYVNSAAGLREATARASRLLGRDITVSDASIDWGRVTRIDLAGVKVANVAWAHQENFLEAEKLSADIEIWPLLRGEVKLPRLALVAPRLHLEKQSDGTVNWSFGAQPVVNQAAETMAPEERDEMPAFDFVEISDGTLQYRDDARKLLIDGELSLATGEAEGKEAVKFTGKGTLEERPLSVAFRGGSFVMLKNSDKPYPLKLAVKFGATEVALEGTMQDPIAFEGTDLKLDLKGPDLAEVFPVLGVPAPPTPPYHLAGQLQRDGEVWSFRQFNGTVGDSDLAGEVRIDYGPERPKLDADLVSRVLDFDDLGPLVGATPDTDETASKAQEKAARELAQSDNIFPDMPLNFSKLKVMDMDVKLTAKEVRSESYLAVTSLKGHVVIENGVARLEPFELGLAEGVVNGRIKLDATAEPAAISTDLGLRQLNLGTFFEESPYFDATDGRIDGRVKLAGRGSSLAEVMGGADGDLRLVMHGGSVSWLLVELIGLDLGQALILYVTEDNRIPIKCAAGKIDVQQGVAEMAPVVVDTTDSILYFSGKTDLRQQTVTLQVEADAKDFSLVDIDAPLLVSGKIRDPRISLGKGVPIPLIEPGDAEEISCDRLINTILQATN
jgi:uncharacterized protein involved in outer membrane biogenesis